MRRGKFQTAGIVGELHRAPPDGSRRELLAGAWRQPGRKAAGVRGPKQSSLARLEGPEPQAGRAGSESGCYYVAPPHILGAGNGGHKNTRSQNRWDGASLACVRIVQAPEGESSVPSPHLCFTRFLGLEFFLPVSAQLASNPVALSCSGSKSFLYNYKYV